MVEQQVVGLKVASSNLSIYPIWLVATHNSRLLIKSLSFLNFFIYLVNCIHKNTLITFFYTNNFLRYNYILNNLNIFLKNSSNKIDTLSLENDFKFFYSSQHISKSTILSFHTKPQFFTISRQENLFALKSFKMYMKINVYNSSNLRVHSSFFTTYLSFASANVSLINVRKFFQYYKTFFNFVSNIFYYKLPFLSFSSSSFKREILSLNWSYLSKFSYMWKYTKPFFFFTPNKIRNEMSVLLENYTLMNFHTAMVLDVFYHARTIHYLNITGFYTFGLVPTNTSKYTLNFALPTTQESILSQVFFIRFLLVSKKNTEKSIFNNLFSKWDFIKRLLL